MNRARIALTAVVAASVVLIAGCGGGGSDETEAPPTASGVDLRTEVLTVEDLPTGWSVDNSEDDDDNADCLADLDDVEQTATAQTEASFAEGATTFLAEGLAYFDDPAKATSTFDSFVATFRGCREIDEDGLEGTIGETSFEKVGDRSNAFTINAETEGFNVQFLYLLVQQGDRLVYMAMGGLGSVDTDAFSEIVDTAVAKIKGKPAANGGSSATAAASAPAGPAALPAGSTFTFDNGLAVEVGAPRAVEFTNASVDGGVAVPIRLVNGGVDVLDPTSIRFNLTANNTSSNEVFAYPDFRGVPSNSVLPGGEITFELAYDATGGAMLVEVTQGFDGESAFFTATL